MDGVAVRSRFRPERRGFRRGGPVGYCNSFSTCCGCELACDSTAIPACCNTWDLLRFAVSAAKSASWMVDCELVRFSDSALRFEIVEVKRFWIAPRLLARSLIEVRATSMREISSLAWSTVPTLPLASEPPVTVVPVANEPEVAPVPTAPFPVPSARY